MGDLRLQKIVIPNEGDDLIDFDAVSIFSDGKRVDSVDPEQLNDESKEFYIYLPFFLIDSHHGVYVPQLFVQAFKGNPLFNWSDMNADLETIEDGPDNEFYWEEWDNLMSNLHADIEGVRFCLYQEEDLFLVPIDYVKNLSDD
jgi:hypothetical protein